MAHSRYWFNNYYILASSSGLFRTRIDLFLINPQVIIPIAIKNITFYVLILVNSQQIALFVNEICYGIFHNLDRFYENLNNFRFIIRTDITKIKGLIVLSSKEDWTKLNFTNIKTNRIVDTADKHSKRCVLRPQDSPVFTGPVWKIEDE